MLHSMCMHDTGLPHAEKLTWPVLTTPNAMSSWYQAHTFALSALVPEPTKAIQHAHISSHMHMLPLSCAHASSQFLQDCMLSTRLLAPHLLAASISY